MKQKKWLALLLGVILAYQPFCSAAALAPNEAQAPSAAQVAASDPVEQPDEQAAQSAVSSSAAASVALPAADGGDSIPPSAEHTAAAPVENNSALPETANSHPGIAADSVLPGEGDAAEIQDAQLYHNAASPEGLIIRLYTEVMGRAPDADGLAFWLGALSSGQYTAAGVVDFFLGSDEYLAKAVSDPIYVYNLYRVVFARDPDDGGLAWHVAQLAGGMSRRYILSVFTGSTEFFNLCLSFGIPAERVGAITSTEPRDQNNGVTAFVARMYTTVQNRAFDADGLNYWVNTLLTGAMAGKQVAASFVFSPEFENRALSNNDFLEVMYAALMGRASDVSGLVYWMDEFDRGASRERVFNSFANSQEFTAIMHGYGVKTGGPDVKEPSEGHPSHDTLTVKTERGTVYTDTVENVLCRVVAGEVGGFRNMETYKAQAVAAHSWILYQYSVGNATPTVADADPSAFEAYGLREAVRAVSNVILTDQGNPAMTTYFASCAGRTNASQDVWSSWVSYLQPVESKYDYLAGSSYEVTRNFSEQELDAIIQYIYNGNYTSAQLTGDASEWIAITDADSNFFVRRMRLSVHWYADGSGWRYTGTPTGNYFIEAANRALGWYAMRSPNFTVTYNGDRSWNFTFYGFGHGVGMSQWGAYGYATQENWNYEQILSHYYPGLALSRG